MIDGTPACLSADEARKKLDEYTLEVAKLRDQIANLTRDNANLSMRFGDKAAEVQRLRAENQVQRRLINNPDLVGILTVREIANLRSQVTELTTALEKAQLCLDGEPEYRIHGMGCRFEDRDITDRYEEMAHGWEQAIERVYGEHINGAL